MIELIIEVGILVSGLQRPSMQTRLFQIQTSSVYFAYLVAARQEFACANSKLQLPHRIVFFKGIMVIDISHCE